jgi:hypothetical protein
MSANASASIERSEPSTPTMIGLSGDDSSMLRSSQLTVLIVFSP